MNHVWNLYEIFPDRASKPIYTVAGEHLPFVTDLMLYVPFGQVAENVTVSIVTTNYRVLSFSLGDTPFVYACIRSERT